MGRSDDVRKDISDKVQEKYHSTAETFFGLSFPEIFTEEQKKEIENLINAVEEAEQENRSKAQKFETADELLTTMVNALKKVVGI